MTKAANEQTLIDLGCWAHCKRRFTEAVEVLKKEDRKNSNAAKGLDFCNKLYKIEDEIEDFSYEDKLKMRQEKSKQILDAF